MASLDVVAHQPRLSTQLFQRLNDRVMAALGHDRAVAIRRVLGPVAATVIGVAAPFALYFVLMALFYELPASARACVGTFPA